MVPWSHWRQPLCGWLRTDLTSEFTHFNLVVHLSKAKQLAFRFCTILRSPAGPAVPCEPLWNAFLQQWCRSEQPETLFFIDVQAFEAIRNSKGRHMLSRCRLFFLLTVLWWGWTYCAPKSLELVQPLYALVADLTTVPAREQRTTSRFSGAESFLRLLVLVFFACHQLVPHLFPNFPWCFSVMCCWV